MGYHVSIVRTSSGRAEPITPGELQEHSTLNSEWVLDTSDTTPSYSYTGVTPLTCWLTDGELWTKNPDNQGLEIMVGLADQLKARVRGDEFETYRDDLSTYVHPDDVEVKKQASQSGEELVRRAKRRHWALNFSLIAVFLTLSWIVSKCSG